MNAGRGRWSKDVAATILFPFPPPSFPPSAIHTYTHTHTHKTRQTNNNNKTNQRQHGQAGADLHTAKGGKGGSAGVLANIKAAFGQALGRELLEFRCE
jgi:hypothetical protein